MKTLSVRVLQAVLNVYPRAADSKIPWCAVIIFHEKVITYNSFFLQSMICETSNIQLSNC
jgi:hypothetical protein